MKKPRSSSPAERRGTMGKLILLANMVALSVLVARPVFLQEIGPKAVWNPPEGRWEAIYEKCSRGRQKSFVSCIALGMRQKGASPEAVAFTKTMKGEVYLSSFREMGKVDLAEVTAPLLNDPMVSNFVLVNGSPPIIELWDKVSDIDITRDRDYPALVRRFPDVELWSMQGFDKMQKLPRGGQRFIFDFLLLNGCRACEPAGSASIALDFDESGAFIGSTLIGLSP